jgi:predicted transposase/invertase (TIGR01784 family)
MNLGVDGYYHHYQLVHHEKSDEVIDGLQLVFIELPKFQPQTFSEKKMQVLWLRFLTEINEKTVEAPAELLENPEVSEALKILEVAAYTPAEMRAYDKFWDGISSEKTIIADYEYKLEQAEAKLKQKDLDTARKLKAMNVMTIEQIAEATGLTAEEIEGL